MGKSAAPKAKVKKGTGTKVVSAAKAKRISRNDRIRVHKQFHVDQSTFCDRYENNRCGWRP